MFFLPSSLFHVKVFTLQQAFLELTLHHKSPSNIHNTGSALDVNISFSSLHFRDSWWTMWRSGGGGDGIVGPAVNPERVGVTRSKSLITNSLIEFNPTSRNLHQTRGGGDGGEQGEGGRG